MQPEISAVQKLINTAVEFFVNYSFQVVGAIIILIAGFFLGEWAARFSANILQKRKMDVALAKFLTSCIKLGILAFAIIIALGKIGITITPLVAALSAAAFGASFAVQGLLANYGAGLSLIISRPFTIGDTITVKDVTGTVEDIKIACTVLSSADGGSITIPNKHIIGEIVLNSFTNKVSNSVIGISYGSDPSKAIKIIQEVLAQNPDVTKMPKPQIGIQAFADSSVNIGYRYWVHASKYFEAVSEVNLAVYRAFQKENIEIPFPQRDIRIVSQTAVA